MNFLKKIIPLSILISLNLNSSVYKVIIEDKYTNGYLKEINQESEQSSDFNGELIYKGHNLNGDPSILFDTFTNTYLNFGYDQYIDIGLTDTSKLSLYLHSKSSANSYSYIALRAMQDVYDNLGNLIMNSGDFYRFNNVGWNTIPFNLSSGDYRLFYTRNIYSINASEIKIEKPSLKTIPENQNLIKYTNHNIINSAILNDQSTSISTSFAYTEYLDFELDDFSNFSVHIHSKSSGASYSHLVLKAMQDVYDNLGNLVMASGSIYSFEKSGWNNLPFILSAGNYKLYYTANTEQVNVSEIKAEKI